MSNRIWIHILLAGFLGLAACQDGGVETVREKDEKQYRLAKKYLNQGRTEEALEAFLRVIESRRAAPECHLEAGYIFLEELNKPNRAIYHFDRYLHFKPDSSEADQVRQLIETAKKKFARQLPGQPYQGQLDRIDLMDLVENLKRENEKLKSELADARERTKRLRERLADGGNPGGGGSAGTADESGRRDSGRTERRTAGRENNGDNGDGGDESSPDPDSVPEVYEVRSGDSLIEISRRVYGTPSRWNDIYQANRDRISDENALQVGQELRIP